MLKKVIIGILLILILPCAIELKGEESGEFLPSEKEDYLDDYNHQEEYPENAENDYFESKEKETKIDSKFYKWISLVVLKLITRTEGIGFQLGWNSSDLNSSRNTDMEALISEEEYDNYEDQLLESLLGIKGGWYFRFGLGEGLSLQPEFNYNIKRSHLVLRNFRFPESSIPQDNNEIDLKLEIQYLDIPLLLKYDIWEKQENYIYLSAGAGFSFLLDSHVKWNYSSFLEGENFTYTESGKGDIDKLNSVTYNIIGGLGYRYERMVIELNYEYNLSKINSTDQESYLADDLGKISSFLTNAWDFRQHSISLSLGYSFYISVD